MELDSSNMIIVTGLPRAGTSVVTYLLATHSDITLFTEGYEIHVLENEILSLWEGTKRDMYKMKKIIKACPTKYILFKRPELHMQNPEFFETFKDAKFIIMDRKYKNIARSWKESPMIPSEISDNTKEYYQENIHKMLELAEDDNKILIPLEELQINIRSTVDKISDFLGLDNSFSTSILRGDNKWDHDKNIRNLLLSGNAYTDLSTNRLRTEKGLGSRLDSEEYRLIKSI